MWLITAFKRVGWYTLAPYRAWKWCFHWSRPVWVGLLTLAFTATLVLAPIVYFGVLHDERVEAECKSKGGVAVIGGRCLANVKVIELE